MNISTKYDPSQIESKWYDYWLKHKFFASKKDESKEPFTIVIPPPNVTGILHMGHILNNTIQDILIRKARMEGKNACWVPGTDHASIATEAKVVKMLREKGIKKSDIGREKFLEHAWEWKEKYGGIILKQLQRLGASCDWDREAFTMDEKRSEQVIDMFIHLYEKGLIYRGLRMVNWDPEAQTVLSKEEVIYKDVNSKLYFVKYQIKDSEEYVTIATTRPETILGDTAICINPKDERYKHLHGKTAIVPMVNREVPIILDEYVDMEFGTGCLKVTPAHDENDYELGKKHNLEVIDILNDDGTLSKDAQFFVGEDRFVVRKKIAKKLEELGNLVEIKDYKNQVGTSERTGAVIEPKLSEQWFVSMKELCKPALENVLNDTIQFHPKSFKNMYKSWIENIQDWNISRQLWWGHRIPAYYLPNGEIVVAKTFEEAFGKAKKIDPNLKKEDLKQDEDVLDTWASSWLWPLSVFDKDELDYYYPTTVLVTGFDIIFLWVMRMIIAGYERENEKPFEHVYFTGMVRDKQRRKMSKSLGNSPDVFKLMDKYSTDGLRYGILSSSAAGNDIIFDSEVPKSQKPEDVEAFLKLEPDSKLCETGRNFANKIWNAFRLIKSWETGKVKNSRKKSKTAIKAFNYSFKTTLKDIDELYKNFKLSEIIVLIYKLIWDDFCSKYLERIKPKLEEKIEQKTYEKTIDFFEKLMQILHPFMPFITEEIWQNLRQRGNGESICISKYPDIIDEKRIFNIKKMAKVYQQTSENERVISEVIAKIHETRNKKQIPYKELLHLYIFVDKDNVESNSKKKKNEIKDFFEEYEIIIKDATKINEVSYIDKIPDTDNYINFVVKSYKIFLKIPEHLINTNEEKEKMQKEIERLQGFLKGVEKKLSNEKFVNNAPEKVVALEKQKKADAEAKIKALEESLASL